MNKDQELMEKGNRILTLNKIEVVVGIAIACITLMNTYASLAVLPYRVHELEKQNADLRLLIEKQSIKTEAEVKSVRERSESQHELLIRMDERLKTVQGALKIPTAQ